MAQIGCLARFFNPYEYEVEFARKNHFDLLQIWYDNRGIVMHENDVPQVDTILKRKFPTIIHAVLDINEFDEHIPKLVKVLKSLEHKEIIIHPVCKSEEINDNTIFKLSNKVKMALDIFSSHDITLYLENNSRLTPMFSSSRDVEIIFSQNPKLEFLLDIAHMDNYQHLKEMVEIKKPKVLHIADKHFSVIHEHLPLGKGDIDFNNIFENILPNFDGKVILEIVKEEKDIVESKAVIEKILNKNKNKGE